MPSTASIALWGFYSSDADARAPRAALAQQHWQILNKILSVRSTIRIDIVWQEVLVKGLDVIAGLQVCNLQECL